MKRIFLPLFMCLGLSLVQAQTADATYYTIQLGAFDEAVKQADFEAIRAYAYVYKRDGLVFIGGFGSEEAAQPILAKIKAKGYDDAFVKARSTTKAKMVYTIQMATKNAGEPIAWKNYARVGTLYSMPNGAQVRITTGAFEDKNDANVKLREVQALGFADAFIKGVKDAQLNPVTEFDTGDRALLAAVNEARPTSYSVKSVKSATPATQSAPAEPQVVASAKRKSVVKLQEGLKEIGYYGGALDGVFGRGTQTSFDRALKLNRRLRSYNELAQQNGDFGDWVEIRLLMTMSRELSVKDDVAAIVPDLLANLPEEPLSKAETDEVLNWHSALWKKLDLWASHSQYNDQVYNAFKIAYYQSLVSLEDYYASKGYKGDVGTAMAVSVIKTMIGSDFDGFN